MPTPPKRATYHHGDLENELIAATVDLIQRKGSHAWSVREVAGLAGVSPAAPHYHFRSRQELAAAVAEEGFLRLGANLDRVTGDTTIDPVERLTSACLAYVRFATENPHLYRAMYAADLYEDLEQHQAASVPLNNWFTRLQRTKAEVFGLFVELVRAGQEQEQLRAGTASDLARLATSLAHGLAREFIDEHLGGRINRHKNAREIFALMLSGLKARDLKST